MAAVVTRSVVRFAGDVVADLAEMVTVRDALADALQECGWGEEDAFRVLICADEAMANALSHGSDPAGAIDIRFRVSPGAVSFVTGDHSTGGTQIPPAPALPADTCEHGRGLILMRALADAFRISRRPGGTMVALGFRTAQGCAR
jgi:anti-sigma regulatory factor (Ser/Thr protein kinase)